MTDRQRIINALKTTVGLFMAHDTITVSCNDYFTEMLKDSINLLGQQPEIVRCKDCKHYHQGFGCDLMQRPVIGKTLDWFCADGERKSD